MMSSGNSRRHRSVPYHTRRVAGAPLRSRMGRENDGVAGLQGNKRLEDRRRCGVGCRNDTADHPFRFGDFLDAEPLVLLDDTACLFVFVLMKNIFCSEVVLDDFVFNNPHTGFLNRVPSQRDTLVVRRDRRRTKNGIHLLLGIGGVDNLGPFDFLDQCFQLVPPIKEFFLFSVPMIDSFHFRYTELNKKIQESFSIYVNDTPKMFPSSRLYPNIM